jgi:hypothetical protein
MKNMFFKNLKNEAIGFLSQYKNENPTTYAAAQQTIGGLLILDGFIGIDNPFGGKKRPGIFGSLIGVAVGLIFIFMPIIFNGLSGFNKMTATTTATVVSVQHSDSQDSESCTAVARYTVSGKEYNQNSSYGSGSFCSLTSGSTIAINYNPDNPGSWGYDVKTISNYLKIFPFFGIITVISSIVTFAIRLLSIIFGWKLLKNGRALAKTLPAGTDYSTLKEEIRQNFLKRVFNFGNVNNSAPAPLPNNTQQPQAPQGGAIAASHTADTHSADNTPPQV